MSQTAILYSHEQLAALRIQPQAEGLDYYDNIKQYHRALTKRGISCDVVDWRQPLEGYKLVIVPSLYLHDEEAAQALESFAEGGGTVILMSRSGVKNMNNICVMQPLPGLFSRAAGITVEEYDPVGDEVHTLRDAEGNLYACSHWCDILCLEGAEPIAWYEDDYYAGVPAATLNRFGAGKVYYIGTDPGEDYWLKLLGDIALDAGLEQFAELPEGVQAFKRTGENRELLFLLNLSRTAQSIRLEKHYRSALTGNLETGTVMLPPFAVQILQAVSSGLQEAGVRQ